MFWSLQCIWDDVHCLCFSLSDTHTHTHTHAGTHTHTYPCMWIIDSKEQNKLIRRHIYLFHRAWIFWQHKHVLWYTHTHTTHTHTHTPHTHTPTPTPTHIELIFITIHNHSNERLFSSQDCIYPWIQVKHPCGMDTDIYHYAASIYGYTFCTTLTNGSSDYAAGNSVSVTPSYHKWPPSTDLSFRQWDMMGKGEREKSLTKRRGVRDDVW